MKNTKKIIKKKSRKLKGSPNPAPIGNKYAEKWPKSRAMQLGYDLLRWIKAKQTNIFFNEFLFIENDYSANIIATLSKKFVEFNDLIEKIKKIQETRLIKYGILGKTNPSMTKFVLINNYGYQSEKIDHTTNNKDLTITVIPPFSHKENEDYFNEQ